MAQILSFKFSLNPHRFFITSPRLISTLRTVKSRTLMHVTNQEIKFFFICHIKQTSNFRIQYVNDQGCFYRRRVNTVVFCFPHVRFEQQDCTLPKMKEMMFDLSKVFDLNKIFALPENFLKLKKYCTRDFMVFIFMFVECQTQAYLSYDSN